MAPSKQTQNPKSAKVLASPQPVFSQPKPSPDPGSFTKPVTDTKLHGLNKLEPLPARGPKPALVVEPVLTLAQVYGTGGAAKKPQ